MSLYGVEEIKSSLAMNIYLPVTRMTHV